MVTTPRTEIREQFTFDEFAQMNVPQLADVIHDGEVFDSDKDFGEDVLIGLVPVDGDLVCDFVELRQD